MSKGFFKPSLTGASRPLEMHQRRFPPGLCRSVSRELAPLGSHSGLIGSITPLSIVRHCPASGGGGGRDMSELLDDYLCIAMYSYRTRTLKSGVRVLVSPNPRSDARAASGGGLRTWHRPDSARGGGRRRMQRLRHVEAALTLGCVAPQAGRAGWWCGPALAAASLSPCCCACAHVPQGTCTRGTRVGCPGKAQTEKSERAQMTLKSLHFIHTFRIVCEGCAPGGAKNSHRTPHGYSSYRSSTAGCRGEAHRAGIGPLLSG